MTAKYGLGWDSSLHPLQIELHCIKLGGRWKMPSGKIGGMGLFHHMEEARKMIWPELDSHRWHTLCLQEICASKVCVLLGPKSSGKTHDAACYGLLRWMADPENTCVLVSSTDIRGLKFRVWAEITNLWQRAVDRFDFLPGHHLESKIAITLDSMSDGEFDDRSIRDMRQAIVGVPCYQGGKFVGLSKFAGIKQKYVILIGDELQFMQSSFLSAFSNLDGNEMFQAIVCGNPSDIADPLGRAAEPKDGWGSHMEPEKTTVWDTRFMSGRCVNLIGTDSPNMDFPEDQPIRYKYLISRSKIASTESFFGRQSFEFYSQCVGCMRIAQLSRRVITRDIVTKFGATEDVNWASTERTKIAGLDAAYGGDRCVCGHIEYGKDISGKLVMYIHPPQIVPVVMGVGMIPEDSISDFCRKYCERFGIPPENFFFDSTGRGSLGTSMARLWSSGVNPVEFGGRATTRPVTADMYIWDSKERKRRLKRCDEHYKKFVTELWFSLRYAIEAGQVRNMSDDVIEEACMREWNRTKDDKIELETKEDMKERVGRSPDLVDQLVVCVEGARRRGFTISKLGNSEAEDRSMRWLLELKEQRADAARSYNLVEV